MMPADVEVNVVRSRASGQRRVILTVAAETALDLLTDLERCTTTGGSHRVLTALRLAQKELIPNA